RKRIVRHKANRFVLGELANFAAEIAEFNTSVSSPFFGLKLLAGVERCDPALANLGFKDELIATCKAKKLFYRLDGTLECAANVKKAPHNVWKDIADPSYLPELLIFP